MESKKETVLIPINLEYETNEVRDYLISELAKWKTSLVSGNYEYRKLAISPDEIIPLTQWQSRLEENERMREAINNFNDQISEIALSNTNIARYGDGFEDAITQVKKAFSENLKKITQ